MASSDQVHVDVAVALVTDVNNRVFLTFNDGWGSFTLPMTKRRRGAQANEPVVHSVRRAAAEALGVPVRLAGPLQKRLPVRLESGRELVEKIYTYGIAHFEPHPDFARDLQIRRPHLWLSPHAILSGAYEPISESARMIIRSVLDDFDIPVRIQHTSALIIQRASPQRGRQFLLRWNPDWGYALPAKRWPTAADQAQPAILPDLSALSSAERVVRDELGLEPGADASLSPARIAQVGTHGLSATKGAPAHGAATDYTHWLFNASIPAPEKLRSDRALVWATQEEIHAQWTGASDAASSEPSPRAGRISRTTYEILYMAGEIVQIIPPEVLKEMRAWSRAIEARLKASARGTRTGSASEPEREP
jgi:hypothetical protein